MNPRRLSVFLALMLALGVGLALTGRRALSEPAAPPESKAPARAEAEDEGVLDKLEKKVDALTAEAEPFDHAMFSEILGRHAKDGRFEYAALQRDDRMDITKLVTSSDRTKFENYLASLANASPTDVSSLADRKAFWINAYNAFAIQGVLDAGANESPAAIDGFYDERKFSVMGRSMTLEEIEEMLAGDLADPRAPFVLADGTLGGPRLPSSAFNAKELDSQLTAAAQAYLADAERNRIDRARRTMVLSAHLKERRDAIEEASGKPLKDYVAGLPAKPIPLTELPEWRLEFAEPNTALNSTGGARSSS